MSLLLTNASSPFWSSVDCALTDLREKSTAKKKNN
jgi:hypothetical protein